MGITVYACTCAYMCMRESICLSMHAYIYAYMWRRVRVFLPRLLLCVCVSVRMRVYVQCVCVFDIVSQCDCVWVCTYVYASVCLCVLSGLRVSVLESSCVSVCVWQSEWRCLRTFVCDSVEFLYYKIDQKSEIDDADLFQNGFLFTPVFFSEVQS